MLGKGFFLKRAFSFLCKSIENIIELCNHYFRYQTSTTLRGFVQRKDTIMIISVSGEYYVLESNIFPTQEELEEFFQDLRENDILELRVKSTSPVHINQFYLKNHLDFTNLALEKSADTFEKARDKRRRQGIPAGCRIHLLRKSSGTVRLTDCFRELRRL